MNDDQAKQGFVVLQVMRLGGIALAVLGLAILAGKIHGPLVLGRGLVVLGVIESLLLPALLARKWKRRGP
jgi:hypothetical protein